MKHALFLIFALFCSTMHAATVSHTCTPINEVTIDLHINIIPHEHDWMYYDYIAFSVDHPDIQLSAWSSSSEPINQYSSTFKETKKVFNKAVTLSLTAHKTTPTPVCDAHLHLRYYTHTQHHIQEQIIPLSFKSPSVHQVLDVTTAVIDSTQAPAKAQNPACATPTIRGQPDPLHTQISIYSARLASYVQALDLLTATLIFGLLLTLLIVRRPARRPALARNRLRYLLFIPFFYLFATFATSASRLYVLALIAAITGLLYIIDGDRNCCSPWKTLQSMLGMGLLATSLIVGCYGYKIGQIKHQCAENNFDKSLAPKPIDNQ